MSTKRVWLSLLLLVGIVAAPPAVDAGYVFMKNGYIIQGRVVEQDDDKVVLRYASGKVTIYQRFIDEVVMDPAEEEDLRQAEQVRQEQQEVDDLVEEHYSEVALELPKDLHEIIPIHDDSGWDSSGSSSKPIVEVAVQPTDEPGVVIPDTVQPDVVVVDPTPLPQTRTFFDRFALSIPGDWIVKEGEDTVTVAVRDEPNAPTLRVHFLASSPVDRGEAAEELRSMLLASYPGVKIREEREEQVGFERAFTIEGHHPERELAFRQVFVVEDSVCFLLSTTESLTADEEERQALLDCLHSFHFPNE